ncbi:MAG TPA: MATE family efflux transporter [Bacteroidota bacterium]|nr:MATE family efflux transporter [Bacteroidota bacterium]
MAFPAIAGLSSQMVVSLVNTSMVGRLEHTDVMLAAMGLGFLASWAIASAFSSLSTGTHVLAARRHGEGNPIGVGEVLNNSLLICLVIGVAVAAIGYKFSYEMMRFFSKDDAVARAGAGYMKYQFLGLPFFLLIVSYRGFFYGIGHTKIFMYSAIIINVFNIAFNYLFIYGAFGFPRMALAGAGAGYALSLGLGWLFFVAVTFVGEYRKQYKYYSHFKVSGNVIAQVVKISIPVSLQNILILLGFLIFMAITGIIGIVEQAASQVIVSALFISIMPCFGFGIAAQTLVGQALGRGDLRQALTYGYETAKLGTIFTFIVGIAFVCFPEFIISVITPSAEVVRVAKPVLQIVGIAQIIYGPGIIIANALQSGGATVYVMMVEVVTHWIVFLPLAYLFGVKLGYGLSGAWMALPVYVLAYTSLNLWKFRSLQWIRRKL